MMSFKIYHGNELVGNYPNIYVQPTIVPSEIWAEFRRMIFLDRASAGTVGGWSFTKST